MLTSSYALLWFHSDHEPTPLGRLDMRACTAARPVWTADGEAADDVAAAEDSSSRHANAAEVLVGVARGAPSALAAKLADVESMRKLLRRGTGVASRGGGGAAAASASGMNNTYARGAPAESSVGGGALNESDADSGGAAGVSVGIAPGTPTTAHGGAEAAVRLLVRRRASGQLQDVVIELKPIDLAMEASFLVRLGHLLAGGGESSTRIVASTATRDSGGT